MREKEIIQETTQFITFDEAISLFASLGVPIGKSTLYQIIKDAEDLPVKKAFGRYLFDREKLVVWIKEQLAR